MKRTHHLQLGALALLLPCIMVCALKVGAVDISWSELASCLTGGALGHNERPSLEVIFWSLRAPRVVAGVLVGAALAVAGASLQGIFRNPLADPGLIGVSSGAALAVVGLIVVGSPFFDMLAAHTGGVLGMTTLGTPLAAFFGALCTTLCVMKLGMRGGRVDMATMLLAGVAINALAGALIGLATYMADEKELRSMTLWTLGSLGALGWKELGVMALGMVPGLVWLVRCAKSFDLLALGEREAAHLGMNVSSFQRRVIMACALVVGVGVGFTGMIGFVGLVVPHILRLMGGASHRFVLWGSLLLGGMLLTCADLVARTIVVPTELPIGVVTALMGAPFFLYLLHGSRVRGMS